MYILFGQIKHTLSKGIKPTKNKFNVSKFATVATVMSSPFPQDIPKVIPKFLMFDIPRCWFDRTLQF